MAGHWAKIFIPIKGVSNPCPSTTSQSGVSTACTPRSISVGGDLPCPMAEARSCPQTTCTPLWFHSWGC
eukprot:5664512-Karenia_brevis.AAC.1